MGFGQHMKVDNRQKDTGYPVPITKVKWGRMTKEEIMAGVYGPDVIDAKITAHNEVTFCHANGALVCRLRETNIAYIGDNGAVLIDTGGWNTITTRRHVTDFLKRHGFKINVWGDKRRGGNILVLWTNDSNDRTEIPFKQKIVFNREGGFQSDLVGNPSATYLTWEPVR